MTNLFTYGSLMCEDIMFQISGEKPKHQKALLNGFFCSQIYGESYPGICIDTKHTVEGILYYDISHSALARLDSFEGEYYRRKEITAHCSSHKEIPAAAYIIKPQYTYLLTGKTWNFEEFLRHGKKKFEANYVGFNKI